GMREPRERHALHPDDRRRVDETQGDGGHALVAQRLGDLFRLRSALRVGGAGHPVAPSPSSTGISPSGPFMKSPTPTASSSPTRVRPTSPVAVTTFAAISSARANPPSI